MKILDVHDESLEVDAQHRDVDAPYVDSTKFGGGFWMGLVRYLGEVFWKGFVIHVDAFFLEAYLEDRLSRSGVM